MARPHPDSIREHFETFADEEWTRLTRKVSGRVGLEVGEDLNDQVLRTGDLRPLGREGHTCQLYRWRDVQDLAVRSGAQIIDASASNWASTGDTAALETMEASPGRWARFLDHEAEACRQPGALDGGTHLLFAARPNNPAETGVQGKGTG